MTAKLPDWTTALPDWEKRIVAKQSLMPCKPIFPNVADIAERIFNDLILVDVMDSPRMGEITLPWVIEFVRAIFGAYDPVAKRRLIREFFLLISKKNTKSTIAAGIMLTALILNDRLSAELIILAPTKEVADNSFNPIRDFVKADPDLSEMFNVSEHTKTVTHLGTGANLKVIAAESNAAAGKKASIILFDEIWLFGKRANAESMFREAKGGLASRPEGCVIYLSTMSDEVPCGVFKQLLDYARDVRDGIKVRLLKQQHQLLVITLHRLRHLRLVIQSLKRLKLSQILKRGLALPWRSRLQLWRLSQTVRLAPLIC
jgi:phage terminase large subunit-like protein